MLILYMYTLNDADPTRLVLVVIEMVIYNLSVLWEYKTKFVLFTWNLKRRNEFTQSDQ